MPINIPIIAENKIAVIKTTWNLNWNTVISSMIARNVFNIIINKVLDAASFIFILANKTNTGTIINPPPIPKRPVRIPTNIPIKKKIILMSDLKLYWLVLSKEIDEKKTTNENKIINSVSLLTSISPMWSGIAGKIYNLDKHVKNNVGIIKVEILLICKFLWFKCWSVPKKEIKKTNNNEYVVAS